ENYIDEDYINDEIDEHGYFTKDFSEVVLGKDEVFLLGDNRVHSLDSRIVGPFKLSQIKAKEVIIIWPLNHGRVVK
ncbi:MAG: S26 family signal peptidase, partial [Traorella sp.]